MVELKMSAIRSSTAAGALSAAVRLRDSSTRPVATLCSSSVTSPAVRSRQDVEYEAGGVGDRIGRAVGVAADEVDRVEAG